MNVLFAGNLCKVRHRRFADLLRRQNRFSARSSHFSKQKIQRSNTRVDFSAQNFLTRVFMGSGGGKLAGWQVFRYRRPPKQGVLRAAASKTTMFQGGMFGILPHSFIKRMWLFDGQFLKSCPFDDIENGDIPNAFHFRKSP